MSQDEIVERIRYVESLDKQWYIPEINIDSVNCLGVALYIGGFTDEVGLEQKFGFAEDLTRTDKKYGSIAIFERDGIKTHAAIYLGDEYFSKLGIYEPLSYNTEEELRAQFGKPKFYENNF